MNQLDPEIVEEGEAVSVLAEAAKGADEGSLGQRLCAAREARGWSRADVAAKLKLPLALVGKLERDDYEGLTQGVFLAGYLGSYARLVDVPMEQAARVAAENSQLAPLVATGTISRSRYMFERYSVSATYLVLTAIIVVPAVWLATHGGLEQNLARTTPLDPPAVSASAESTANARTSEQDRSLTVARVPIDAPANPVVALPAPVVEQQPVIASMAPFVTSTPPASVIEEPKPAAAEAIGSGAHSMTLKLSQASWVEILGDNGQRLEYATLAAGTERTYRSNGVVSVRLGNAQGAELHADGKLIDLASFQRGNVAHFKLDGSTAARSE